MLPLNTLYHMDCMDGMAQFPDKYFELAIVDPPYGIGGGGSTKAKSVKWDDATPDSKYYHELIRVSKNQIIWGANYASDKIPFASRHTIVWDKENGSSFMSDGEIAFTSFNAQTTRFYRLFWMSNMMKPQEKPLIHPTQKPISLYKWLLKNYARQGDKILDTHVGSASSLIACYDMGFDFIGFELDADYHKAATERLKKHMAQERFEIQSVIVEQERIC